MPRPTAAQLAYGSATVVLSTLAMLLLSQARPGIWVTVIAFAGLALGLLIAMTLSVRPSQRVRRPSATTAAASSRTPHFRVPSPRPRPGAAIGGTRREHSLRR
ncbi:hypothetical protein [Streptomyces sp. URMC 123]|uniref:hypothetical protein n=1 Tax=Streptomyces sp. URMC 123 TaxID=3423403 RepID=UPI003F1D9EC7